ncbi:alpha/beta hydrolase [Deinococcus cavernae]|uniref:alpha/beta hydrolase n=1 Tax=Deinococcus cavernae TaxID=2320857 RepID=UPI001F2D9FFB|nr:alpha/beta hydrolase [Deinococcus cavernae]
MRKPALSRLLPALILCLASTWASAGTRPAEPVPAPAPVNTVPITWAQVGPTKSASLLAVPDHCLYTDCALIVVSHPRGQTPERLRSSPEFSRLTLTLLKGRFAVLLSSDGGPLSWGSPQGLQVAAEAHRQASRLLAWNGRSYALGLSMGGLMALRSTLPGGPYPVDGLALIDPWVNLQAAWHSSRTRQQEIKEAYGENVPLDTLDPLPLALQARPLPLWIASSPDDKVVPRSQNAALLQKYAPPPFSRSMPLSGPHLGGNRFSTQVGEQLLTFFQTLEERTEFDQDGSKWR